MNLDQFFSRRYSEKYNCAHFVVEVWQHMTGDDIAAKMGPLLYAPTERTAPQSLRNSFVRLKKPEDPCIVLMQKHSVRPHVGLYFQRLIIHLHTFNGVQCLEPCAITYGFDRVSYYKC